MVMIRILFTVVSRLQVPLVKQVTGSVATTVNKSPMRTYQQTKCFEPFQKLRTSGSSVVFVFVLIMV